jgi:hypothetical protein
MKNGSDWLHPLLAQMYAAQWEDENLPDFDGLQEKFVFHVADAAEDVRRLGELLNSAAEPNAEDFTNVLGRFFLHAVPHLVAAGQLFDYVPEIFPEQKGVHVLVEEGQKEDATRES